MRRSVDASMAMTGRDTGRLSSTESSQGSIEVLFELGCKSIWTCISGIVA